MRVEHYRHELPEFGITVYGGLAALGSVSTEELDDRMANWRPALMSCDELVGSLGWLDYAPIRMTHSPPNNQLEPYPDLSKLLPYIRPVEERLDADDPVQSVFTLHYREIFLGERPDWKLVGFQVYPEAVFLLYNLANGAEWYTKQWLSIENGSAPMPEMHLTFHLQKTAQGIEPVYHVHTMSIDDRMMTVVREQRGSTQRDMVIYEVKGKTFADVTEYVDL